MSGSVEQRASTASSESEKERFAVRAHRHRGIHRELHDAVIISELISLLLYYYGARARAGGTCLVAVLHAASVIGCWGRAAGAARASVIVCW